MRNREDIAMTGRVGKALAAALCAGALVAGVPAATAKAAPMGRDEVRATADCVVEQSRHQVEELFATLPGSPDEVHAAHRLNTTFFACLGGDRRVADDNLGGARAALAVALVVAGPPATPHGGVPWYRSAAAGKAAYSAYDPKRLGVLEFGTCMMTAAPKEAAALVRADPDSVAERQALDAMRPVVGPCMTKGVSIHLNANELRLMLAEPVYHATQ
jgi:hypothetical protein